MKTFGTKTALVTILAILLSAGVLSQNPRFIYIQTESKQPFYVKIDGLLLNSSATGYILIPQLEANSYELTIGFYDTLLTEKKLMVHVDENGTGYLLKRINDIDWSLDYLKQDLCEKTEIQMPPPEEFVTVYVPGEFARILAEVVNDPSIAQKTVLRSEVGAMNEISKIEKPVAKPVNRPKVVEPVESKITVETPIVPPLIEPSIDKLTDELTEDGILLTYVDKTNLQPDTVKLFIPVKNRVVVEIEVKQPELPATHEAKPDARFIDMELQNPNQVADSNTVIKDDFVINEKKKRTENISPVLPQKTEPDAVTAREESNNDCKKMATAADFLALRKRMAADSNEKEMRKTASIQFAKTCFNAEQVKNLGVLFIVEEERYKFFVDVYPFVSDKNNFQKLEEQLNDTYYKERFKALLAY